MVANGLKARTKYIKERKMVQVSGLLHCDLVTSDRLLLNGLSLKIVFHRRRNSFILMTDDVSRDCRVRIIEAQLCVKYVKLPDKKYRDIQQFLLATSACYSIKRVVMKTHSVAQGISSLNWVNAHAGQLPNSVYGC